MKQHISTEQLHELSPEAQERLREWWKPKEHDIYYDGSINTWEQDMDGCIMFDDHKKATSIGGENEEWDNAYPLLSIGQMIEFLTEYPDSDYDGYAIGDICQDCDALFEAVKEILERKES